MKDKIKVLRKDGGKGELISVERVEGVREGAKAKKEVSYKIQGMCSAKAHSPVLCVWGEEIYISKAQLALFV